MLMMRFSHHAAELKSRGEAFIKTERSGRMAMPTDLTEALNTLCDSAEVLARATPAMRDMRRRFLRIAALVARCKADIAALAGTTPKSPRWEEAIGRLERHLTILCGVVDSVIDTDTALRRLAC